MNNSTNTQSGERLSFFKLFSLKKYRILIPIIQRDYAQGRKTTKEVRDTFLSSLYNYLDENKSNRDLDFVYGSLNEVNNVTDFILLDGQQRLTTLFLLHWYLCQISNNSEKREEFKNALLKDEKSMFTYETRSSSSEFCSSLMNNDIDFDNLLKPDKDSKGFNKDDSLSKTIKNCSWFYMSWQYDPTIQSMITMLDAIHSKFANKKEFFERLLDTENPVITFFFLNLKDFNLTDDLYIKMNSRGIPLTAFENFKAKFEHLFRTLKTERKFSLTFESVKKDVSLKEYFSYNIDTKWANLFWNYRTLQNRSRSKTDDTFDDELMNFIRVIFTNQYALSIEISSKDKDDTLEYLLGTSVAKKENKDYSDIISYHKYKELKVLFDKEEEDKYLISIEKIQDENEIQTIKEKIEKLKGISIGCVLYLIDAFDSLSNGSEEIKLHLSDEYKFYFDEQRAFENALIHNFDSNHQRLCFHAYVRYLIYNKNNLSGINQWMRVIHNLTHPDNTVIDNATEVASAIKSIEELLPNSSNILNHLQSNPNIALFASWQVFEEKIKAHLISKDDKWNAEIEKIEKHGYFNGQIGFLLEFAGVIEYYTTNKNCNWTNQQNSEYFTKFTDYAEKACKIFEDSYDYRKNNKNYIFERAVLAKGDYLTSASQNRYNLLSTNLVKNNVKRDHSWKKLLRIINEDEWVESRSFVKDLFDDKRFNIYQFESSLLDICQDKTNSWRDFFINCPSLIDYCRQGFIRYEDEHSILLYGESQSNFYHSEMHTYYLWKKYIEQNKNTYQPFQNIYYNEVKSIEEEACIVFEDFCYNRIYYQIEIYYCNNDNLPNPYEIKFYKPKGGNLPENYGDDIKQILNSLNFFWSDEYSGYFFTSNQVQETLDKLTGVTNELNKQT